MGRSILHKLRQTFLPPESPQELFLRTLYHRLNASPWFINRQIKAARSSYRQWRDLQLHSLPPVRRDEAQPTVAFLLFTNSGQAAKAQQTFQSIAKLNSGSWQVIPITDDGSFPLDLKGSLEGERVLPPANIGNLKQVIGENIGVDFLVFCGAGDVFDGDILDRFQAALSANPAADIYYFDCELQQALPDPPLPFFKPTENSPELLLSINYLSRGFIRRLSIKEMLSSLPEVEDTLGLELAMMLRLLEQGARTCHIPRLLVSQAAACEDSAVELDAVIQEFLSGKGKNGVKIDRDSYGRRIGWKHIEPSVSIIILNRDHGAWLRTLVNSIFALTDYSNYSLIIVDNNSTEADVRAFYTELADKHRVQVVHYDRDFNYSEAINTGVEASQAEVIVLLNNDMQVTSSKWLSELVRWAVDPQIGVVGGKLLHRNGSIQHAGIILGMNGFIGHLYLNAPEHYHGLAGSVDWYRNFYALTGACQAMRRRLFYQVGGYDERFRLAFGDIDFCLRVFKAGYRNLYNPYAELIHYEGGSRGYETPVKDILLGYDELGSWLKEDDAYFSPNLTYTPIPQCNFTPGAVDARLVNIENRKQTLESGKG
ncbi:MAG TPA: glycosyltransferase family 2 protein [Anaerolineaceae bacterium]|nr:glycosyltransferase family 2 protein [Anaerolineaceae bacterium]